jgi:ELWxxDGT repeat protein
MPSRLRPLVQELERRVLLSAAMVKDLNTAPAGLGVSPLAQLGDVLLFSAIEPGTGEELYRSDGTRQGTTLVKDINPGPPNSGLGLITRMTVFGGKGYFGAADTGTFLYDLWVTDATPGATQRLTDFRANPGNFGSANLVAGDSVLYFTRAISVSRQDTPELWKTEGTAASTSKVADLPRTPRNFIAVGDTLYFTADVGGQELWRSDGTAAGTVRVADINPGSASSDPQQLTRVGNDLFFTATSPDGGRELWKTDAASGGVVRVKDINPGSAASNPERLTVVGNTLFFAATEPTGGTELWKSDGTEAGTVRVKDLVAGTGSFSFAYLFAFGGRLFFQSTAQAGLYASDGTDPGTVLLAAASPAAANLVPAAAELNGVTYIAAGAARRQFFRTDGTPAGTSLVKDFSAGTGVFTVVPRGGTLFLTADDGASGRELWRSDGTEAGTALVTDINPGPAHGVSGLNALPGGLVLTGNDGVHGAEPWVSDGSAAGTVMVSDFHPGTLGTNYQMGSMGGAGGALYFSPDGSPSELWRSDGTAAGTYLVKNIAPDQVGPFAQFTDMNGTLFFETGTKLWKSDGTAGGTVVVRDFASNVDVLTPFGATLYFTINGRELWKTDGTPGGTVMLLRNDVSIRNPAVAFGRVFFSAYQADTGQALWTTDGTVENTRLFKDLFPGPDSFLPIGGPFTPFNGVQLFRTTGGQSQVWQTDGTPEGTVRVNGVEFGPVVGPHIYWLKVVASDVQLWRGDGTPNGTEMVKQVTAAAGTREVLGSALVAAGGRLFFPVRADGNRYTVYASDGTADGTRPVGEIPPINVGLLAINNSVYATAGFDDGVNGLEIYRSDGTPEGTGLMQQIRPGAENALPRGLTVVGDELYFWADDGLHGMELWKFTPPRVAAAAFDPAARPGGSQVSFTFSEDLRASLSEADLVVTPAAAPGTAIRPAAWSYDAGTQRATFTFNPVDMPTGDYTATLDGRGVRDVLGNALPRDYVLRFFVLPGDVNRDRAVNGTDFALLAGNFGKTGMTYGQGDLNGDGFVNGTDFAILAGNFGKSLAPQAVSAATKPVSAPAASASPTTSAVPKRTPQPRRRLSKLRVSSRAL